MRLTHTLLNTKRIVLSKVARASKYILASLGFQSGSYRNTGTVGFDYLQSSNGQSHHSDRNRMEAKTKLAAWEEEEKRILGRSLVHRFVRRAMFQFLSTLTLRAAIEQLRISKGLGVLPCPSDFLSRFSSDPLTNCIEHKDAVITG